jgi:hypothetical protein
VRADKVPPRRLVTSDDANSTVRVLVVESGSGLPSAGDRGGDFIDIFGRYLEEAYSPLKVNIVRRVIVEMGDGPSRWTDFVRAYDAITGSSPNLVLLVCRPDTAVHGGSAESVGRFMAALADQALSQTQAGVVAVGPPPVHACEDAAAAATRELRAVCDVRKMPFINLYSPLVVAEDWRSLFRGGPSEVPVYLLSPVYRGRKLMADRLYTGAMSALGDRLSEVLESAKKEEESDGSE